jgi:hypothetical protein
MGERSVPMTWAVGYWSAKSLEKAWLDLLTGD